MNDDIKFRPTSFVDDIVTFVPDITRSALITGLGYGLYMSRDLLDLNEKETKILRLGSFSIMGYGVYSIFSDLGLIPKKDKEVPDDISVPGSFILLSGGPNSGDDLGQIFPYSFKQMVTSPLSEEYTVYMGSSLRTPSGEIWDGRVIPITIPAKSTRSKNVSLYFFGAERGDWQIRYSVWNKIPSPTAENLVRLADTGWVSFTVSLL